jgi:hypothetical protein
LTSFLTPRTASQAVRGFFCSFSEERSAMSRDQCTEIEKVREALGGFLDWLAKAVADGLARRKQNSHSSPRRSPKPLEDESKSTD